MGIYLDGIPVLAGKGVLGSLLEALLALRQSLVPINRSMSASSTLRLLASYDNEDGRGVGVAVPPSVQYGRPI